MPDFGAKPGIRGNMYIPNSFKENRIESLQNLVKEHPLGLLVTSSTSRISASPVPFLLYQDEGEFGVLRAHMAKANPHWKLLLEEVQCLVVFQGPQGYVTPTWYPTKTGSHKVVPTWNYAVVQAWGSANVIEDEAWIYRQIADLTNFHEHSRPTPWSLTDAPHDFISNQLQAVIGIEIPITRLEGKFKMSQNRPDEDRKGVAAGASNPNDPHFHLGMSALVTDKMDKD